MRNVKFVQSCYLYSDELDPLKLAQGFAAPEFHWMSWCLSCLQLTTLYGDVTLYTNEVGKDVLIDKLKLPYSNVVITETNYPQRLWALNKIHTYSQQQMPFIHVDGDVFLWKKLGRKLITSPLVVQNIEANDRFYRSMLSELVANGISLPEELKIDLKTNALIKSCNAGIFGGNDLSFFDEYTNLVFSFTEKYQDRLILSKNKDINMAFEQCFFYYLALNKRKEINCLIDEEVSDMNYPGIVNFYDVPDRTNFIHMLGTYKKSEEACKMLAKRLRINFPFHYYNTIDQLKIGNVRLYLKAYNNNDLENDSIIDWNQEYAIQKTQQIEYDKLFVNHETFLSGSFMTNKTLFSVNDLQSELQVILTPCSLESRLVEREVDKLDNILIYELKDSKSVEKLILDVSGYFESEIDQDERVNLIELLMIKLRRGCEDNLFYIVTTTVIANIETE